MREGMIFRGAASQYLALTARLPARLSFQLAYKDDIHCASLRPCRTGYLEPSKYYRVELFYLAPKAF